jgi:ligand-binding sensor domain-containing protein
VGVETAQTMTGPWLRTAQAGCLWAALAASQALADWSVQSNVMTVRRLQADSGSVWAVTSGGLYRHAGVGAEYEIITTGDGLGSLDLYAAARSGDSFWLAGTGGVLSLWNAGTHQTDRFSLGLGIERVEALLSSGDTLWLGTNVGVGLFLKNVAGGLLKEVYSQLGTLPSEPLVKDLAFHSGLLWAATEFGVVSADAGSPSLYIPSNWTVWADPTGALATARRLAVFQDSLFVATDSGLFVWTGGAFAARATQGAVRDLFPESDSLWLASDSGVYVYTQGGAQPFPSANLHPADLWSIARIPGGSLWAAFSTANLYEYGSILPWFVEKQINQPRGSVFMSLALAGGMIFCAQREEAAAYLGTDRTWADVPTLYPSAGAPTQVVRALGSKVYVGNSGQGMLALDISNPLVTTQYNSANSVLEGVAANAAYTVVSALAPDAAGGAWTANRFAVNGQVLVYFGPGGTPQVSYGPSQGLDDNDVSALLLADGQLWIGFDGGGLGVLEFRGTPDLPNDDTYTLFTGSDINLPASVITSLLEDHTGHIWVGTPGGLARLDREFFPFVTVEFADVRPADPNILALAEDGSGAVWVGTGKGLCRIPNGSLVADSAWFAGSSPLPANQVMSLQVDRDRSMLWVGTDNGLLTRPLVSSAVSASPNVFPNPFEIRYSGDRATFEVPSGSVVDIFTLDGSRVRTLASDYRWDGRNESGQPVAAGLYLFRVTYADGTTGTGRLGIVR